MKLLASLLTLAEADEVLDADEDEDDGSYEREQKVGVLILRVFRKCGLDVAEHDDKHGGVRDRDDRWGYDVLYTEDGREAMVTLVDAELDGLAKLHGSGLIDGKCAIGGTSDGALRLTFSVRASVASGRASLD
jgi:hypothetical protein